MECEEEQGYLIGTPEWSAFLHGFFIAGLARLQVPPPSPTPLEAASQSAFRRLMEIEREMGKGKVANPIVVANAHHLRRVYHHRLITLGKLSDALSKRTEDDELYVILNALDAQGTKKAAQESVPAEKESFGAELPCQDLPATNSTISSLGEADQPTELLQHDPIRASALQNLRVAAKIANKIPLTPIEQAELDAKTRMQDRIMKALIGEVENLDSASDSAGTAALDGGNKMAAPETIAHAAREPQSSPPSEGEIPTPKSFQSGEKLDELMPSAEATKATNAAEIEGNLQDGIKRILELKELEAAWWAASPRARDEFLARLMKQPLDLKNH